LEKLCRSRAAEPGIRLLSETGLYPHVFPFLPDPSGPAAARAAELAGLSSVDGSLPALIAALNLACEPERILGLAKRADATRELRPQVDALRLSVNERKQLVEILHTCGAMFHIRGQRPARRADLFRSPHFNLAATLVKSVATTLGRDIAFLDELEAEKDSFPPARLSAVPMLKGADLAALGLPEGPLYGRLLAEAADLEIEGALDSREEALSWLARRARELAGT